MNWLRPVTACALAAVSPALAADVPKPPLIEVKVDRVPMATLLHEFQTNEVRAEAVFSDRTVEVSGAVVRVVRTRYVSRDHVRDAYEVELKAEPLAVSDATVRFYFDRDARDQLLPLRAGQEVVIRGRCSRPFIRAADLRPGGKDAVEVRVTACQVVEAK
jgi:hypothetical protein